MSRARSPYSAILFDMGYTLVYFEPKTVAIVREALLAAGVERSDDEIRAASEANWRVYYTDAATRMFPATEEYDNEVQWALSRDLLARLGLEGDDVLRTYQAALEAAFDRPATLCPFPEVPEVLARLKAEGYRLGIISNWSWHLRRRVTQAGLDGFFEMIWASAYAGCNKPHPAIFQQALAHMHLSVDQALYVGDSYEHDVLGARAAGLDVVLVDRATPPAARDCRVIPDLGALLDVLDGHAEPVVAGRTL